MWNLAEYMGECKDLLVSMLHAFLQANLSADELTGGQFCLEPLVGRDHVTALSALVFATLVFQRDLKVALLWVPVQYIFCFYLLI